MSVSTESRPGETLKPEAAAAFISPAVQTLLTLGSALCPESRVSVRGELGVGLRTGQALRTAAREHPVPALQIEVFLRERTGRLDLVPSTPSRHLSKWWACEGTVRGGLRWGVRRPDLKGSHP